MDLDKREELLFQILTELHLIRVALTDNTDRPVSPQFACVECNTRVPEGDLEQHAQKRHKWHSDLGGVLSIGMYERIDERD
jgi:hypothetical protein